MVVAGRSALGSTLALISAVVFALNVVLVPLIYDLGGNIHAVNLVRPLFFFVCVSAWVIVMRTSLRLPSEPLAGAVALGGIFCIEFYAVHSSVKFIPVGLAILVMYTYPLLVALLSALLGRSRLSLWLVLIMAVTFMGLMLALGASSIAIDYRGVGLAFLAALGMCALVMISETSMQGYDNATVMFYSMLSAGCVMLVFSLSGVPLVWPETLQGISAIVGATICYVVATALLFVSISMIGPLRFAVIDNTAPVWATLLAIPLLGESLSLIQWLGVALVVGGVISVQFLQHRNDADEAAYEEDADYA